MYRVYPKVEDGGGTLDLVCAFAVLFGVLEAWKCFADSWSSLVVFSLKRTCFGRFSGSCVFGGFVKEFSKSSWEGERMGSTSFWSAQFWENLLPIWPPKRGSKSRHLTRSPSLASTVPSALVLTVIIKLLGWVWCAHFFSRRPLVDVSLVLLGHHSMMGKWKFIHNSRIGAKPILQVKQVRRPGTILFEWTGSW